MAQVLVRTGVSLHVAFPQREEENFEASMRMG